ncbi:UDP-N-acetylglucosamine--LPS N-acetylglucosamine transferase [Aphanothece hegewaldii CCALA 016]|uniref:UDP-N-acetylglucosamine--LPS N-acetylglucosamine transferase n=1 Tax=Aphanothece hegewaldii CCALA 016 TaxID=2107694 RepID=A0A2T1M1U0_9CHRO|nr:PssD/Cps14F family polysaccharide biosynthesis glycosyltransferase [Aphanothece hegewaldii]PSF38671.1 UDP-N-acetylglucosamine--LPS N-acetylglucosamine transferase [Aphanothece hegewaldii CCALA 016]
MRLLLVCNPGGHFSTMLGLKKFWSNHDREWVTYPKFDTEILKGQEIVHWVTMQEARMIFRAIINFFRALFILLKSRPDVVIPTGASLAVPFIFAAKLLRIKTVYVESITRSEALSLSGKLIYNIVDELYVQWPNFVTRYPRVKYHGIVV